MFSFLKSKPVLSENDRNFQLETYKWLFRNFGAEEFHENTILVLPTREHFPQSVSSQESAAIATFESVKKHAGMEEWECELKKQEENIDPVVAETLVVQNAPQDPQGTFSVGLDDKVVITYDPSIVTNPTNLVATFAHELAHYLTATSEEPPPGGWDNWEFVTDIAAVFMGFGIFLANSAFTFNQYHSDSMQGWQTQRSGYLSEAEYAYALAIFAGLKGIEPSIPVKFLDKNIKVLFKKVSKKFKS